MNVPRILRSVCGQQLLKDIPHPNPRQRSTLHESAARLERYLKGNLHKQDSTLQVTPEQTTAPAARENPLVFDDTILDRVVIPGA